MMRRILAFLILVIAFSIQAQDDEAVLVLPHDGVVTVAAWNSDETQIMTASEDGFVRLWSVESGDTSLTVDLGDAVRGSVWNSDETHILAWTSNDVYHIEFESGTRSEPLPRDEESRVNGARWIADDTAVMVWGTDGVFAPVIRDRDWTAGMFRLLHDSSVLQAEYDGERDRVYTFTEDGTARIWASDAAEITEMLDFGPEALGAAWSEDDSRLLVWRLRGGVQLIDPQSERLLHTLSHRTFVNGARWNADDTRVMSWAADDTVKLWDADSGAELLSLLHNDWVNGATWNNDETRILSWAYNTAYLWDAETGALVTQFTHDNIVNGAAFNADETRILTWGWDDTARVWVLE
jgi:WD40 repeat protein